MGPVRPGHQSLGRRSSLRLALPAIEIFGDLMSHMRYPKVRSRCSANAGQHHVVQRQPVLSEISWQTPVDPTERGARRNIEGDILQPPWPILSLQTGGPANRCSQIGTSSYIPAARPLREILTGFGYDSDAGHEKGKIGSSYGTIRLQELPKDSNAGPRPGAQEQLNEVRRSRRRNSTCSNWPDHAARQPAHPFLGEAWPYVQPVRQRPFATSFPRC